MSRVEREAQTPEKEKKKAVRIAGNMDVGDILSKALLRGFAIAEKCESMLQYILCKSTFGGDTIEILLTIIGIVSGIAVAIALYVLFARLRQHTPMPVVVIGWGIALCGAVVVALLLYEFISVKPDRSAPMAPAWAALAFFTGLLLAICASMAGAHARKFQLSWSKAFGLLAAEAGATIIIAMGLNELLYPIADILRKGSRDVSRILDSFAQAHSLVMYFDLALIIVLLLLEVAALRDRHPSFGIFPLNR